jgi:putative tryptophan/tyrosine transport system substrate-binding protein
MSWIVDRFLRRQRFPLPELRCPKSAAKLLRGSKPSEVPAELPTKFELVVNLRTAKRLGIVFPTSILLRADEVIE